MRRSENFLPPPPPHTHTQQEEGGDGRRRRWRQNLTTCHVSKDLHVIVVSSLLFLLLLQGKQLKFIMLCLPVGWGTKLWLPTLLLLGSPFGAYNCHDNSLCLRLPPLPYNHSATTMSPLPPQPVLLLCHTHTISTCVLGLIAQVQN